MSIQLRHYRHVLHTLGGDVEFLHPGYQFRVTIPGHVWLLRLGRAEARLPY